MLLGKCGVCGGGGGGGRPCTGSKAHPVLGKVLQARDPLPGMMVFMGVVGGLSVFVPSAAGKAAARHARGGCVATEGSPPTPPLLGFVPARPPTWAAGQAPRQGPVLRSCAPVFLPVEGSLEDGETGA
jgi:hypothetical protein